MSRKRTNPHKPFMVFNAILFFAVLFISGLFLYLAYTFKQDAEKKTVTYEGTYHIELANDFVGKNLTIYVNDSLVLNQLIPDSTILLNLNRFAEEHALIVVDNETDKATPFNLNKEGGKVIIKKIKGEVVIEEKPSRL